MEKSILSIFIFVCVLFALLICPQISLAGYQSADSNLPPLGGHYISPQQWHALYANGVIVKDPIHSVFTATFPPPMPGYTDYHTFGSRVEIMVSMDGGTNYYPFWGDATVTVQITGSISDPNTYDTEMTQLDVSGGSLPANVMLRESLTLASTGRTTIKSVGGGYQIDSFFDVYTEVSTDGGGNWYPDTNAPAHMELAEGGICDNPVGDLNADNVVDWSDLGLLAAQWLQVNCDDANGWCSGADLNESTNVNFLDYALQAANWEAVGNCSPLVSAGLDDEITLPSGASLNGMMGDEYGYIYTGITPPGPITALWTKQSGPNDVTFGDANAPVTTASFVEAGVYVLRLTANDGELTTYDEVTVTVNPEIVNLPPDVDAGSNQQVTMLVGASSACANLDGTVSDDGLPDPPADVNTLWTVTSGPNDVVFGDANLVDTTACFYGAGVYVLRLDANDSVLGESEDVWVTVVQNQPAAVNAGIDQQIVYSYGTPTSASLDGTVTDDGLPNPPGAVTTLWTKQSGTGTVTFTDANAVDTTATFPDAGGVFVLRLTANDGDVNSYDEVQITVVGKPAWGSETANYYVDGFTGSDTNAGTSKDLPWKTITKAATTANAGKKVLVWGGGGGGRPATQTYVGSVSFSNSGSSGNVITYRRDPASGEAIVDANGTSNYAMYSNGKSYITIDGFTLTNGMYGLYALSDSADYITIKNCRVRGNNRHGIYINQGDNCTINNCAVYANNTIGSSYANIYIYNGSIGNQITSCTVNGLLSPNQGKYGIQVVTGSATVDLIRDCIVTNHKMSGGVGINEDTAGIITAISYCDVWNNTTNYSAGCPAPTNSKSGDPGFTDPANGNFVPTNATNAKPASDNGWMGYRLGDTAL